MSHVTYFFLQHWIEKLTSSGPSTWLICIPGSNAFVIRELSGFQLEEESIFYPLPSSLLRSPSAHSATPPLADARLHLYCSGAVDCPAAPATLASGVRPRRTRTLGSLPYRRPSSPCDPSLPPSVHGDPAASGMRPRPFRPLESRPSRRGRVLQRPLQARLRERLLLRHLARCAYRATRRMEADEL